MKLDLPATSGEPLLRASIKLEPADFIVKEELDFDFDHSGEHWYLRIRKCGLNTSDVSEQLQRVFKCQSVDIGISGLKDKNAITEQWFSVRSPKTLEEVALSLGVTTSDLNGSAQAFLQSKPQSKPQSELQLGSSSTGLDVGDFELLEAHRHSRKLRRGAHRFNQFTITLRNVVPCPNVELNQLQDLLNERLQLLQTQGFANYFGPQRFGHNHQNIFKAERLFQSEKRKVSRAQRGILISAARSQLFNAVCAERVRQGSWNTPLLGEPMMLSGTNSYFVDESLQEVRERCAGLDVHTTGPMWGRGSQLSADHCLALESQVLEPFESLKSGLEKAGLEQQRRALRAQVFALNCENRDEHNVKLNFKLLKGVYATSLLAEFMINL